MTNFQTLAIVSAIAVPLFLIFKSLFVKNQVPHAAGGKLLTGHTDALFSDPFNTMKEFREKYGSLYSIDYLGKKVIVFGKMWIDELFKNKDLELEDAVNEIFLVAEAVGSFKYIHDKKISGAKIVRTMITPYLQTFSNIIYEQVKLVEKEMLEGKGSILIESPAEIMRNIVVKVSSSIILGIRLSEDKEISEAFYNYPIEVELSIASIIKYLKYPLIGRLYARYLLRSKKVYLPYQKFFLNKISVEIATRKIEEKAEGYQKPNDLIQKMLDEGYSTEEILFTSLGLASASVMTTTNNSALVFYDLVTYPEYYNELYEEQLQVKKEFGDTINSDIVSKMPKLNSFIRESMRFRMGGVTNFRFNKTDWALSNGITIPKGSLIGVDSFSLHFDNELQGGNPYEFKPFRHAENKKLATKVEVQNISFGLGQHACPGRFLAVQEISTILSVLIRNYKISTQDRKPHPYRVRPSAFSLPKGEPLIFTKITV